jgi:GntR family transcriptional regulator, transcriptional repressor for pyruvate dehydrogenase complex
MMACHAWWLNSTQVESPNLFRTFDIFTVGFGRMAYRVQASKDKVVAESSLQPFRGISRNLSLSDKVVEQLTEAITSRRLAPGELLPSERDLGDKFKVSRTVVREAIRSLAARGLVRVTSGRGVEVNEPNSDTVADSMRLLVRGREGLNYGKVNEVRTVLEVQTAALAALRATPEDFARLEKICDDHERALSDGDMPGASELDFQFHRELTRASHNELLLAMLDSISDVLREIRHQSMNLPHVGEDGLDAHRLILKSVKSGSAKAARDAMAKHLAEAERIWIKAPGKLKHSTAINAKKKSR